MATAQRAVRSALCALDGARSGDGAGRALAEDDHPQHFVLGNVTDAGGADGAAVLHHCYPVGQVEHVVDIVADEEDADALGLQLMAYM